MSTVDCNSRMQLLTLSNAANAVGLLPVTSQE